MTKEEMLARLSIRAALLAEDSLGDLLTIAEEAMPDDLIDWAHELKSRPDTHGF